MMTSTRLSWLAIVAIALLAGACGGTAEDAESGGDVEGTSGAETVAQDPPADEPEGAEEDAGASHGSTPDERIAAMADMLGLDDAQVEELRTAMGRLHAEAGTEGQHPRGGGPRAAEFRAALEAILTADQLARFDAHVEEARQQRQ